jgi:hypothetical protein
VIEGLGKREIHAFVLGAVAQLVTDDWASYQDILGVRHNAITLGPMAVHIVLPWTRRLFSNLKRWGLGVYHGPTFSTTWTNSCSVLIGAGHAMLHSLRSSVSAPAPPQLHTSC